MNWMINLDESIAARTKDIPLLSMVRSVDETWPDGATCATQEQDGEILYWSAPINEVRQARKEADFEGGLMPLIGIGKQVHANYYEIDDEPFVSNNWSTAVVTHEMFLKG